VVASIIPASSDCDVRSDSREREQADFEGGAEGGGESSWDRQRRREEGSITVSAYKEAWVLMHSFAEIALASTVCTKYNIFQCLSTFYAHVSAPICYVCAITSTVLPSLDQVPRRDLVDHHVSEVCHVLSAKFPLARHEIPAPSNRLERLAREDTAVGSIILLRRLLLPIH